MAKSCECDCTTHGFLSMGQNTHKIPLGLYLENRTRLCTELKKEDVPNYSYVLLQGGKDLNVYDTDTDQIFKQESYFRWTFGVVEPGCYGAINIYNTKSTLFIPKYPTEHSIWIGPIPTKEDYKKKYYVDEVEYVDDISEYFSKKKPSCILTLKGVNSDSDLPSLEASFEGIEEFKVDDETLYPIISELRVLKTDQELAVIKYVIRLSAAAHRKVLRLIKPGWNEYQGESVFLEHIYSHGGARHTSYGNICSSGSNSSVLHYGHAGRPNDRRIENGDMCLFDMGANYFGYCADITVSFPVNGKFTSDQRIIYEAVLRSNLAVQKAVKPGISWVDMHRIANREMLMGLKDGGLLKGDVDEMLRAGLGEIFQPHGLGHLIGLDVHDVGGYLPGNPPRSNKPGLRKLRTSRIVEPRMVMTIEPGCYFIEPLLKKAFNDPDMQVFLVAEVINRFRNFGGVRIEDDVIITENGMVNVVNVPRTCDEIERWMAGLDDDKYH